MEGLKDPALTPGPEYIPPAGNPPVRLNGAPSKQELGNTPLKLTAGGGSTVTDVCVKSVQVVFPKV
jgi:hypothetical protein